MKKTLLSGLLCVSSFVSAASLSSGESEVISVDFDQCAISFYGQYWDKTNGAIINHCSKEKLDISFNGGRVIALSGEEVTLRQWHYLSGVGEKFNIHVYHGG